MPFYYFCTIRYLGTFECGLIVEGEPLYLDNLRQGTRPPIAYICGKKSGVNFEHGFRSQHTY